MTIIIVTCEISQNETPEYAVGDLLQSEPDDDLTAMMGISTSSTETSSFCDNQATTRKFQQIYLIFLSFL